MSHSSISAIWNKFGGRRAFALTRAKLGVAVLIGAGLGYAPTLGLGEEGNMQELPDIQTALQGPLVTVVKVLDPANEPDKYGVETYAPPGSKSYKAEGDSAGANFDISTSGENVNVTITIPKDYLLQFEQEGDPIEVISASVVIKAGKSTCIWNCYWSNGVKVCECVQV